MNIADEIRQQIEKCRELKLDVGEINNHLSILEGLVRKDIEERKNEAYQRGYDKGYADKTNNDEVGKELAKDIYQRGLDDAWEAARKIIRLPEGVVLDLFTDCYSSVCTVLQVFLKYEGSEVIEKLKAYEEKQKADDEIKVGDEVIYNNTIKCLVVRPETDERYASLIDGNGYHHSADHRECKKTGRHFDIEKILEEMKA